MKTVSLQTHHGPTNLAIMEHLLKNLEEDFFLLFENRNTLIVGRHQNTDDEVNPTFVKRHRPTILRRLSGGGAVYQDIGNLNVVFITSATHFNDFTRFTSPILNVLRNLGLDARFTGRNDITIDGKKVSGNAQVKHGTRMMHGATILFDADLTSIANALTPDRQKLADKGVKSVRARIQNVKPLLASPMCINQFKDLIMHEVLGGEANAEHVYHLTDDDLRQIEAIQRARYENRDWNVGKSPSLTHHVITRTAFGTLSVRYAIRNNHLTDLAIHSDALTDTDHIDVEAFFRGVELTGGSLLERASEAKAEGYDAALIDAIVDCLSKVT